MTKFHNDTCSLALKKVWDSDNGNLFITEYDHFTAEGYATYWSAVDATVKFTDTILWNKLANPRKSSHIALQGQVSKYTNQESRFTWRSEKYNQLRHSSQHHQHSHHSLFDVKFKSRLLSPPPYRRR